MKNINNTDNANYYDMEMDNERYIVTYDSGKEKEYIILKAVNIDGVCYAATIILDKDNEDEDEDEGGTFIITRFIEHDGEITFNVIPVDENFDRIYDIIVENMDSDTDIVTLDTINTANNLKPLDSYRKDSLSDILKNSASLLKKAENMIDEWTYAKMQIDHYSKSPAKAVGIAILCSIFSSLILAIPAIIIVVAQRMYMKKQREIWAAERDRIEGKIENYYKSTLHNSPAAIIPSDFRHSAILEKMVNYIGNMEATTWKECVAVWKTDAHRTAIMEETVKTREFAKEAANNSATAAVFSGISAWNSF